MSISRIFVVFVLVALVLVAAFTVRAGIATLTNAAANTAEDHSYDSIENLRAERDSSMVEDHSYDDIERIRSTRGGMLTSREDHSYDEIERIRSTR